MTQELFDPLASKRKLSHDGAIQGDNIYSKNINIVDYSLIQDGVSALNFNGESYQFVNTVTDPDTEIQISADSPADQRQIIYNFLQPLVDADDNFTDIRNVPGTNKVTIEGKMNFTLTVEDADGALTVTSNNTFLAVPSGSQIFNLSKEAARLAATALVNVYIVTEDEGNDDPLDGSCNVNFWAYDEKLQRLCLGETNTYPGMDSEGNPLNNRHARPYKFDIAGQSFGITISQLQGNNAKVYVSVAVVARITGGN